MLRGLWDDFWALWRLIRAWRDGSYTKVPWRSIIFATGALIYFVSPIDVIPDFIPFIGYVDDGLVIAWTVNAIRKDLEAFRDWEAIQEKIVPAM